MSAFPPIATDLLQHCGGRKVPRLDQRHCNKINTVIKDAIADYTDENYSSACASGNRTVPAIPSAASTAVAAIAAAT